MPHQKLDLDNGRKMDFEFDSAGKLKKVKVHHEKGVTEHDENYEFAELTLDGQKISWLPDGTLLKTGDNSYYYYFFGGRWYRITV